jgi:hypothetical protein
MDQSCGNRFTNTYLARTPSERKAQFSSLGLNALGKSVLFGDGLQRNSRHHKKVRPRSDAATDGDRWGRVIVDGGPDQTQWQASLAL